MGKGRGCFCRFWGVLGILVRGEKWGGSELLKGVEDDRAILGTTLLVECQVLITVCIGFLGVWDQNLAVYPTFFQ